MNIIEKILESNEKIIIDGALGTQIQENGYDVNDSLWSAKYLDENPEVIKEVHREYLQAGANCIISSSYQASIEGFLEKGFSKDKAISLIKESIYLAKDVRDEFYEKNKEKLLIKPLVAASIGPYGAYLANGSEYSGDYNISDDELKEFHKRRLEIILETKPDIIAIETIPSFNEAKIIVELLESFENITAWLTFSAKDENFTNAGDSLIESVKYFETKRCICSIGVNCTAPQYISAIIQNIKSVSLKPIIVYPNGGSKYNPITKVWERGEISAEEFAKMAHLWYQNGARLIGGCCETTPDEIKEIKKILE